MYGNGMSFVWIKNHITSNIQDLLLKQKKRNVLTMYNPKDKYIYDVFRAYN